MSILEISQILFNLVASIAIGAVAILFGVIAINIIKCILYIKKFLNEANKESAQLYSKINNFLEGLFNLSFVSRLFSKKNKKHEKK